MTDYKKGALGAATVLFAAALLFVGWQTWARVAIMWNFLGPIMAREAARQVPPPAPAATPSPSPSAQVGAVK